MKPANAKARALLLKLQALAERGINGERDVAAVKIARLKAACDFTAPDPTEAKADIFGGRRFARSGTAAPIATMTPATEAILWTVKAVIENRTGIVCLVRDGQLLAEATPGTLADLARITGHVALAFADLWRDYSQVAGVQPADRSAFLSGLYDGLMQEARPAGQRLPARATVPKLARAKKRAVKLAPGLELHPYTVAVPLGKGVRFSMPLDELKRELAHTVSTPCAELT